MWGWVVAVVLPLMVVVLGCLTFRWLLRNDPFWKISAELDEHRRKDHR